MQATFYFKIAVIYIRLNWHMCNSMVGANIQAMQYAISD